VTQPGYHGDGAGLWLQITKTGAKSWIFRYTVAKRQREMGLGPTHTVTLPEAREKAKACRNMLLEGIDPLETRKTNQLAAALEKAKMMTFDQCAAAYIEAHRPSWKNVKHIAQWESTIKTYASPVIGSLPVAEVDTALIIKVLEPIWLSKQETATRLRGRLESVLDWATTRTFRQGENPARWKGHLENLLPHMSKTERIVHHPSLPWQEINDFLTDLRQQQGIAAKAVEFTILTACRSGEVRGCAWTEIDLASKTWKIPAARMKAGREHSVPLSDAAIEVLASMPRMGALVFPGARGGTALSDMSLTAVLRRMERRDITVHGFRSSFRMWAAESTAFPRDVCEQALAHSLPDKVEAAYQRSDLFVKRIHLMQAWADYCNKPTMTASVTPINRVKAA
jgi:integrase